MSYQSGLWAKYYNYNISQTLTKSFFDNLPAPLAERAETKINHGDGTTGSPEFNYPQSFTVDNDYGAIVFNGSILAPVTGTVRLYLQVADDEWAGLYLNGSTSETLEKPDHVSNPNEVWVDVQMTAGQYIPFVLKYVEFSGNNLTKLSWSYAEQAKEVIPASAYFREFVPQHPMPTPTVIGDGSNRLLITAPNYVLADIYADYGFKVQVYKNGQPYIVGEVWQEPILDENGDVIDFDQFDTSTPQLPNVYVGRGDDGNGMTLEVLETETATYTFKIVPRSTDTFHDSESGLSEPYVYTAPAPPLPVPTLSIDYGVLNGRYLSQPVFINSTQSGVIKAYRYEWDSQLQGTVIVLDSTLNITAGTPLKYSPRVAKTYVFKFSDGTIDSDYSQTVQYIGRNYKFSLSGNVYPATNEVGTPITVTIPNDASQGYGEGGVFCLRDTLNNDEYSVIETNVVRGGSFQFIPQTVGVYVASICYPETEGGAVGTNNDGGNQIVLRTVAPSLPVPTISYDYGSTNPRYLSQPTKITSTVAGSIKVYSGGNLIVTLAIQANQTIKHNPTVGGFYAYKYSDGTSESSEVGGAFYSASNDSFQFSPTSGTPYRVGQEVTFSIPSYSTQNYGEGGSFIVNDDDGVFGSPITQNIVRGQSFTWTPTKTGTHYLGIDFANSGYANMEINVLPALVSSSALPVVTTASPQFTGTAIAGTGVSGATIKIYKNGVHLTSVVVNGSGGFSYTPASDGTYTFTQTESGKTESAQTSQFTVNAVFVAPPAPAITSGLNGQIGTLITGTISQAGTVLVFKNGTQVSSIANQTTGFSYSPTSDGAYTFKLSNGNGTSEPSNSVVVPLTYEYEAIFNDTCGNPLEYAISQTISDVNSSSLVWQSSKFFQVGAGTQYNLHAREIADHSKTKSVVVTTLP